MPAGSVIDIRNLSMKFGQVGALDDVSLQIAEEEFFVIVGQSGCGKSTLMLLVAGLLLPSAGTLLVQGQNVTGPRTEFGIAFQHHNLLEWRTILQNVMLPVEIRGLDPVRFRKRAHELLAMVGLKGFEDHYPYQLSGGMQQRAAIVRALIHEPAMLLMDEPFGALDALTREEHQLMLQEVWLRERKTVIFITHDVREAILLADRVAVMSARPGRIVDIIDIDLPRPREQIVSETPEFNRYVHIIRDRLAHSGHMAERARS